MKRKKNELKRFKKDVIKSSIMFAMGCILSLMFGLLSKTIDDPFLLIFILSITGYIILISVADLIISAKLIVKEKNRQSIEKAIETFFSDNEFKKIKLLIPTELMRKFLKGAEVTARRNQHKIEVKISFLDDLGEKVTKTIFFDEEYASAYILDLEE